MFWKLQGTFYSFEMSNQACNRSMICSSWVLTLNLEVGRNSAPIASALSVLLTISDGTAYLRNQPVSRVLRESKFHVPKIWKVSCSMYVYLIGFERSVLLVNQ